VAPYAAVGAGTDQATHLGEQPVSVLVQFESEPGERVPAQLVIPIGKGATVNVDDCGQDSTIHKELFTITDRIICHLRAFSLEGLQLSTSAGNKIRGEKKAKKLGRGFQMKVEEIRKGMVIWLPCEVRGGPFPDERRVYVRSAIGEWFGFVNVSELDKKVPSGKDRVRGIILEIEATRAIIGINGQSPISKVFRAEPSLIEYGAL